MSAESPRRSVHKGAQVVSPQPVSDRSIIDSVAGIINDIVPQAYTGSPNVDNKESISWARFEYADVNDPVLYPDYNEGSSTPPLLLVLGYGTGVQVWLVSASGEATEVLSWRQGVVRTLRFLPNPKVGADQIDLFESKRPMVAICDSAGPGPQFCNVGFISLKTGEQVKSIKFKNPVSDVLANRRSVVVTFAERIAVFDANNLEDVLTVTSCYPSPGPNPNPVALGTRWLAYSEKKLIPARRSSGGSEGEGAQSYTATVLHAAKSLGKGLRGLGETVASTLTGNSAPPLPSNNVGFDGTQPGVVTILDLQAAKEEKESDDGSIETVLAHFTAHGDAIVAMAFDLTGALLITADRRGHDFHVFRIQPHPGGPTLAAVHHLYVLHRGDTTAKVQDMTFSSDARWAAISTVRGTTHVFPIAPYGGPVGIRTHSTPHVVNRLSRFHRSAGLTADGTRSHSPVAHIELPLSVYPYSNPRLPPYPHPTILHPLAQIRQPSTLNHVNNQLQPRPQQRQRLHSEDSGSSPLKICCCFAPQRAWLYAQRDTSNKVIKRAVDSLFVMACHGNMIQYDLDPKPAAGVPKEKVCDDTMIELDVEAKGQWPLLRSATSLEIAPPLPPFSPLLGVSLTPKNTPAIGSTEDQWLSQVEIVTHAGPHRRLWMGPQFIFKTYNAPSGVAVNLVEAEAVEIGVTGGSRPARSNPVNMPHATTRPLVPVVIDGSGSSYEQSPRFLEAYGNSLENENVGVGGGESQLREDLAEAMLETAAAPHRVAGRRVVVERMGQPVAKVVNPLGTVITVTADDDDVGSGDSYENESCVEPLRSLCALEGPASINDFEQEYRCVKNLSEVCAEIRSTVEPAIDSVSNEDMKEVVETKALYAEAASLESKTVFKFRSEESCRDVEMTLNLCAKAGKIPNSPMTRAKEGPWSRETNPDNKSRIDRAKYVVNYDDEKVVCTENKFDEETCPAKSERETSRNNRDSVKATRDEDQTGNSSAKLKQKSLKLNLEETTVSKTVTNAQPKEKIVKKKTRNKGKMTDKIDLSFETIKDSEIDAIRSEDSVSNCCEKYDASELPLRPSELPIPEPDVSSEYSILEKPEAYDKSGCFGKIEFVDKQSLSANQSDEDLEHIHSSEVPGQVSSMDKFVDIQEPRARRNRKTSRNMSSDDDMEHIQPSEISELVKNVLQLEPEPVEVSVAESPKSSGNDEEKKRVVEPEKSENKLPRAEVEVKNIPVGYPEPSQIPETSSKVKAKSRYNKNRKKKEDIVVVVADTTESEVIVVESAEVREAWSKRKTTEEDPTGSEARRLSANDAPSMSKRGASTESIEIIDIDAMRKAEIELEGSPRVECKVVAVKQELSVTKSRKSRKKKCVVDEMVSDVSPRPGTLSVTQLKMLESEVSFKENQIPAAKVEPIEIQVPVNSWSSIVKTKKDTRSETPEKSDEAPRNEEEQPLVSEFDEPYDPETENEREELYAREEEFPEPPSSSFVESTSCRLTPEPEFVEDENDAIFESQYVGDWERAETELEPEVEVEIEAEDNFEQEYVEGSGQLETTTTTSSKEASPELDTTETKEDHSGESKPVDSSNSPDELTPSPNPLDTEEDNSAKENVERNLGTGGSIGAKKGRSKKKKRR